jgi:hypothetical protein
MPNNNSFVNALELAVVVIIQKKRIIVNVFVAIRFQEYVVILFIQPKLNWGILRSVREEKKPGPGLEANYQLSTYYEGVEETS